MILNDLILKLTEIKNKGFVRSLRTGSTGVGYTFETLFGLTETNIPIPDIGGRVEIKTTRKDSTSLITLFCFNKGVWRINQRDAILKYGYIDEDNRRALKTTIFYNRPNSLGLLLEIDEGRNVINLRHQAGELIASWDIYEVIGKFYVKFARLLLVIAERRTIDRIEEFHFKEAYLLTDAKTRTFLNAFKNSIIGIDLRMHLKENNSVRNRGTGFRINELDLNKLYGKRRRII